MSEDIHERFRAFARDLDLVYGNVAHRPALISRSLKTAQAAAQLIREAGLNVEASECIGPYGRIEYAVTKVRVINLYLRTQDQPDNSFTGEKYPAGQIVPLCAACADWDARYSETPGRFVQIESEVSESCARCYVR